MNANGKTDRLTDDAHRKISAIVTVLGAAHGTGKYVGCVVSYREVNEHLAKVLASAEDELKRGPTSELVMGEIMTLKKLIAHFAPASEFYEQKSAQCTDRMTMFVDELVDAVNELHATKDPQGEAR